MRTTAKIDIRKALFKDLPILKEICDLCFPDDDAFSIVKSLIDIKHFYVVYTQETEEIMGFVAFGIYSIDTAHIMILAVHPKYQNKGVGTKLLEFTLATIRESHNKRVRLEVKVTNQVAIDFYKKHGFVIKGTIREYYDDHSDGYLMVKELR